MCALECVHLHNDAPVKGYILMCNHTVCINLLMSGTVHSKEENCPSQFWDTSDQNAILISSCFNFAHFANLAIKHKDILWLSWNLAHIKGSFSKLKCQFFQWSFIKLSPIIHVNKVEGLSHLQGKSLEGISWVAHKIISLKNQPQFSQPMMGQYWLDT